MLRLESVPNALEQARQACAAILENPPAPIETSWFWSNQFDVRLQIAGVPIQADTTIVRGDPASGAFSVFRLRKSAVVAVEAANSPADFMTGKQMILRASMVDSVSIADVARPIKSLMPMDA